MLGIFATARNVMAVVGTVVVLDNLVPQETQEKVAGKLKDGLSTGLTRLLYGPAPHTSKETHTGTKVRYDNLRSSAKPSKPKYSSYVQHNKDQHHKHPFGGIKFPTFKDAAICRETLMDMFEDYGTLTIADVLSVCGVTDELAKFDYYNGWCDNNLHDFDIRIMFNDTEKYYYFSMPDIVELYNY